MTEGADDLIKKLTMLENLPNERDRNLTTVIMKATKGIPSVVRREYVDQAFQTAFKRVAS